MFVVELTYTKSLEAVESHLAAHVRFLDKHYAAGVFIVSGRKEPRTGGIILAQVPDRAALDRILAEDPFFANGIAEYRVTEFLPTKYAPGFAGFVS